MIYFDYAATSWPKPTACIHAIEHYITEIGSNPAYSLHKRAREGDDIIENARANVASLLGVHNPSHIIFTLNATQAINQVLWGMVDRNHRILASNFEHSSVTRPLAVLGKRRKIDVEKIGDPVTGLISPELVHKALRRKKADLLVFTHASNITGAIQPVKEIVKAAHDHNCPVLVDAAQTVGAIPLKTSNWGVDFLAFSGHKNLLGPMGVGGFYLADPNLLDIVVAGSTGYFDDCDSMPSTLPHRFEPGTPNAPGIAGLGASCRLLNERGVNKIRSKQTILTRKILKAFTRIPGLTLYGPSDARKRIGLIGFNIENRHPNEVGDFLDQKFDIMVRTGLCSCHWANQFTGTMPNGLVRASIGYFTEEDDVDLLIEAVKMIAEEALAHG